jgi:phosphate transport system protein
MSRHLQKDIEDLKSRIIRMGEDVEDRVYRATLSIIQHDEQMAQEVIAQDDDIDRMEVEIEENCLRMLALYQPVAVDLRFIITVLKINNELERVGDLAVNIAERSVFLDVRLAYRIRSEDDDVDAKNREMYARLKDAIPANLEHINYLLHALSVGRHLERIADHATNIAEEVIYLVDAEIVRHTPETFEE